jgi:2-deoxy-D-gluconate 3-dehydrogenase
MMPMPELFSLSGRTAFVTGASRGLGQAIAVALAGAGADVVCHSTQREGTDDTVLRIRALGRRGWQVTADLADREAVQALTADVDAVAPVVDILVNNAGTIRRAPAVDVALADWDAVLRINLDAAFILAQHFGRSMVTRGYGKIINVASLLSYQGGVTVPAYTSSKHAIAGLTRALANEWAVSGVQVNAIAPGYFRTDNTQALQDNAERAPQILSRIPAGRWGEPDDVAGAAVFLASRASEYVNGHLLAVDGGWMAR